MPRLSIGDRVMDATGTREGKLVDIDGDTGYVLQPNGVEVEFPLERLRPYDEDVARKAAGGRPAPEVRVLDPARRALLASVPAEIRAAVARSYERGADAGPRVPFDTLSDPAQLEAIRIHLPSLPRQLLASHLKLVVAFRDLAKPRK